MHQEQDADRLTIIRTRAVAELRDEHLFPRPLNGAGRYTLSAATSSSRMYLLRNRFSATCHCFLVRFGEGIGRHSVSPDVKDCRMLVVRLHGASVVRQGGTGVAQSSKVGKRGRRTMRYGD